MNKHLLSISFCFLIGAFSITSSCNRVEVGYDILITNGRIVDGTGNPWFYGDIGITGDTIAEIGDLSGKTAKSL
jgi:adenine deaminase